MATLMVFARTNPKPSAVSELTNSTQVVELNQGRVPRDLWTVWPASTKHPRAAEPVVDDE